MVSAAFAITGVTLAPFANVMKDFRSANEKRAYYRLLRHLLSEKLQTSYKVDEARPLPSRMTDLLKTLEHCELPAIRRPTRG